jgi:hypothetical protein
MNAVVALVHSLFGDTQRRAALMRVFIVSSVGRCASPVDDVCLLVRSLLLSPVRVVCASSWIGFFGADGARIPARILTAEEFGLFVRVLAMPPALAAARDAAASANIDRRACVRSVLCVALIAAGATGRPHVVAATRAMCAAALESAAADGDPWARRRLGIFSRHVRHA